ncbi:MAG: hypothetical protein IJ639_02930 [Ruminococcus sp.]|nr:hypothetical protein [Ruminococcus sp.]
MLKKGLSLILSLLICIGAMAVMPLTVNAEENDVVDIEETTDLTENDVESDVKAIDVEHVESISEDDPEGELADVGVSADIAEEGANNDLSEQGVQYSAWSSWSTTPAYASSTRQVETRRVVVSYDMEGNCCGNSSGQRCYLKYMQDGYTLRLHYERTTYPKSQVDTWAQWPQGSYYTYAANVNGYIIGPGTAYIEPNNCIPYFIVGTNYETQYHYRDRVYTPISRCVVTLAQSSYTYDGAAKTPDVTVKYGSTVLKKGTDYTVTYQNNIRVGTATVVISGIGDYNGSISKNFTITASAYSLATPVITKLKSTTAGVSITWKKVSGAAKYRVYLKTSAGWKKLCDTAKLTYTYTAVQSGTKYTFSVRCLSADAKKFTSDMNQTGWAITYFATPKIKSLTNAANGVKLTWNKIPKAVKYRVFLITSGGVKKLGDTTSTSYVHKAAKSGVKYTYTVCCITSDGSHGVSAYNTKGWAITFIAMPQFKSISYSASGHVLKWKKIAGAPMYCVLIKSGGKWKTLAYTAGTTYTYKKAKAGVKYTYSLRCVNKSKKAVSAYDTKGKVFQSLNAPKITKVTRYTDSLMVCWNHVKGASKYRLYYRYADSTSSSWSKWYEVSDVSKNSNAPHNYYYHRPIGGKKYQYRVRCINSVGNPLSAYSNTTSAVRFCKAPSVYRACVGSGYLRFYWYHVTGAYKYKIYIWENNRWKTLSTTFSDVYYYYTNNTYGTHRFAVRAVDNNGNDMSEIRHVTIEYHSYSGIKLYTY